MAFVKNENFDPNDPTSKRFILEDPVGDVSVVDPFAEDKTTVNVIEPPKVTPSVNIIDTSGSGLNTGGERFFDGTKFLTDPLEIERFKRENPGGFDPLATTPPQKKIFRVGNDIFDASSNRKLGIDEFNRDFSGKATEITAPANFGADRLSGFGVRDKGVADVSGGVTDVTDTGGVSDVDSLKSLVEQAGKAGISLEDTLDLISRSTSVTTEEKEQIRNELGIPDLISETFKKPSQTTQEIYIQAFNESGLPKIKQNIATIDEQINKIRSNAGAGITAERKNPFISQATRSGNLRIIAQDAEQQITNLNVQRKQLLDTYDQGIDEIEGVISRFSTQLEDDQTLNVQKLNFLLDEAERQAGGITETREREGLRVVPDFLKTEEDVDPFSKEALDIKLKNLEIEKKRQEIDQAEDKFEREKLESELEVLEGESVVSEESAILQNKIDLIDELLVSKGINGVVGTTALGRIDIINKLTGESQNFSAGVAQLVSKETIDTLVNLKARGGTLGALSDQERVLLQNAATKIGNWEIKDKSGFGTGRYDASEKDFIKELEKIKELANTAIEKAGIETNAVQKKSYDSIGFDIPYEEAVKTYGRDGLKQIIDSQKKNDKKVSVGTGMRTDRHNNPTAFTIDIAKQAGLVEGVDYEVGDAFPNNPNQKTALLIGDPVEKTINVIDKIGFFTQGGKQRWTHTAMSRKQWDALSPEAKKQVIREMYKREGNDGKLNNLFV